MKIPIISSSPIVISSSIIIVLLSLLILRFQTHLKWYDDDDFLQCLSGMSDIVYTPDDDPASFSYILTSKIGDPRFKSSSYPKPAVIVTPKQESQIKSVVKCARKYDMLIRTRSGGHEFEGLSYTARTKKFRRIPFVIIDLRYLNKITIDEKKRTVWVQSGATLGQIYYKISQTSRTLTIVGGAHPSVGAGGYFSGGGYSQLIRKFGFGGDNVIDARIIDVNGSIHNNRVSMGEDVFWAIRGGGGNTFGIVTAWKLRLVSVPETITVFSPKRTLEQGLTQLMHKWQFVAPHFPHELTMYPVLRKVGDPSTVVARFDSHFLGRADALVELLEKRFPELGVKREDCLEVSWIQVVLFYCELDPINTPPEILSTDKLETDFSFIAKVDYVEEPMPVHGFEGLWNFLLGKETGQYSFAPYGGKMDEIPEDNIPYPHRKGNLYTILVMVSWDPSKNNETNRCLHWSRKVYEYLTPFVSKTPRGSFINYRDLDLGFNSRVWGVQYFNKNFERLVQIKTKIDPENFFRHEQSVPPMSSIGIDNELELDDERFAE